VHYAETQSSFEEVALKFLQVWQIEALKTFLKKVGVSDKSSGCVPLWSSLFSEVLFMIFAHVTGLADQLLQIKICCWKACCGINITCSTEACV
jgi:hypothetical protein